MKKTVNKLVVALMVMTLAVGLMACSSQKDSKYVGEWKVVTGTSQGIEINLDSIGLSMIMSLKADGSVSLTTAGQTGTGTWKETDNGIELMSDGETIAVTDVDGKLQFTEPTSGVVMVMEKQS